MPIVASQHSWKDPDHSPSDEWPDDCFVQWGGSGVVLGKEGSRRTAFFEAFPKSKEDAGFIRGEGSTIAEAEENALTKYRASIACDHMWSRAGYTNGGTICRKCKAFNTGIMLPVYQIGSWKEPLREFEIESAIEGRISYRISHPDRQDETDRYTKKTWLRLRYHGVDVPPLPEERSDYRVFDDITPYGSACRDAMCQWIVKNPDTLVAGYDESAIDGFFKVMMRSSIRREVEEWQAEQDLAEIRRDLEEPYPEIDDSPGM